MISPKIRRFAKLIVLLGNDRKKSKIPLRRPFLNK